MFDSLGDFIGKTQELDDCRVIENADWDLEIGAITEWASLVPNAPLLLFDKIKDYPPGYRVASNLFTSQQRTALALGLPLEARGIELVKALREKLRGGIPAIPPVEVENGPVKQNVRVGDEVDLFEFPAPKWHELDGGRFIGTGCMVITRDPDERWVNLGAYRGHVFDRNTVGANIVPGHHGDVMRRKYWSKGESCPAAMVCGSDPVLWSASSHLVSWGLSEYDYAGGFRGKPIEVVRGVTTDLLIPAQAEIVLEGEIPPPEVEKRIEGPFGEAAGYYGQPMPKPVFRVKSVMFRDNPIIQGNPPLISYPALGVGLHLYKAAQLWDELDRQLPGVTGVWHLHESSPRGIMVIALKQSYPGQAKQAALAAAGCLPTAYAFKYIVVVDDDIDPSNNDEVMWAIGTRSDPERTIDIVRGCWGTPNNPELSSEQISRGEFQHGMALILACKQFQRIGKDYPETNRVSPELMQKVQQKWGKLF